jgi:hypothetical protein
VDSYKSSSNYGNADLKVSNSSYNSEKSYLSFIVDDLPSDANIITVRLGLSVKWLPFDDHTVPLDIWKTTYFDEMTLIWENRPEPTVLMGVIEITENKRWTIPLVNHSIKGNTNFHICLSTELDNSAAITFDSRDDLWNPPRVEITYESSTTETESGGDIMVIIMLFVIISLSAIISIPMYVKNKQKQKSGRYSLVLREKTASPKYRPTDRFCGQCGSLLELDNLFCTSCGKKQ